MSSESPSHRFDIDINIAKGIGINVKECDDKVYKLSKQLILYCTQAKQEGLICKHPSRESQIRMPFFHLFGKEKKVDKNA